MTNNTTIKEQAFGVEIEMTGISRKNAARITAKFFGTEAIDLGTYYATWGATDSCGRTWKFMFDSSISAVNKDGIPQKNTFNPKKDVYKCEFVTPILHYEDLETLKKIMNLLIANGAVANSSTGIHVHVSADHHNARTLETLLKLAIGREGLIYEALEINSTREYKWCKKINKTLADAAEKAENLSELERVWYSSVNEGGCDYVDHDHYNRTRYHGVNLHSFFTGKGVEFRYFNGATDPDKISAYVKLCLAINAYAINNPGKKTFTKQGESTPEQRKNQWRRFIRYVLGMSGEEFRRDRKQLTAVWAQ